MARIAPLALAIEALAPVLPLAADLEVSATFARTAVAERLPRERQKVRRPYATARRGACLGARCRGCATSRRKRFSRDNIQHLRMLVRKVRQKLEDDPSQPKLLLSEIGRRLSPGTHCADGTGDAEKMIAAAYAGIRRVRRAAPTRRSRFDRVQPAAGEPRPVSVSNR
jgi:hypothetical protein